MAKYARCMHPTIVGYRLTTTTSSYYAKRSGRFVTLIFKRSPSVSSDSSATSRRLDPCQASADRDRYRTRYRADLRRHAPIARLVDRPRLMLSPVAPRERDAAPRQASFRPASSFFAETGGALDAENNFQRGATGPVILKPQSSLTRLRPPGRRGVSGSVIIRVRSKRTRFRSPKVTHPTVSRSDTFHRKLALAIRRQRESTIPRLSIPRTIGAMRQ